MTDPINGGSGLNINSSLGKPSELQQEVTDKVFNTLTNQFGGYSAAVMSVVVAALVIKKMK